jgi:hypothetical protein
MFCGTLLWHTLLWRIYMLLLLLSLCGVVMEVMDLTVYTVAWHYYAKLRA